MSLIGTTHLFEIQGNESELDAMRIGFTRTNSDTIIWKNALTPDIPRLSDLSWILPGMRKADQ